MGDTRLSMPQNTQLAARTARLIQANEVSQRYGLSLSEAQITSLVQAEGETLRDCRRLEFGEGILPRLVYAFCDSPYMMRHSYAESLDTLQDLFYTYKNELGNALSDDELLEAMHGTFHGKAQGSFEYMESIAANTLLKALRSDGEDDDDD